MTALEVIDAHVHLWDPAVLTYAWLDGRDLNRRFDLTDLAAAGRPPSSCIVVQADCADEQALREADWIAAQRHATVDINGIVAFVPVERGREIASLLAELCSNGLVVGVRRLLQDEPAGFMNTPSFLRGLSAVADAGLPFDVCVREHQLGEAYRMAHALPELQFVLDHLGKPQVGSDSGGWRADLSRLAALPNVVCKLSGLSTETSGRPFTAELVRPYLEHALTEFGPLRCLFGSDWPVLTSVIGYDTWFTTVLHAVMNLGDLATAQVLADNARRVYAVARPHDARHQPQLQERS